MFKNREFCIRVVKTDNSVAQEPTETKKFPFEDPEQMNAIAKDFVKGVAKVAVCVLAASIVLHTASEIIIRSATNND